ncbi:MAG: LysR family transcriptional regulator [Myxococcales bacterium]|nr:LysR family transcriptional regulator [Myxococcales bacterium]
MIQLHRLEGFYWVAVAGGYARAARQFPYPITQPAVHQQVRKLEADLGTRLFERVAKDQMELTAAGRHLHRFCAPFFEQLPAVVRAIETLEFGGPLRIDAAGLPLRHLLPSWVKRLRKRRPDIEVELSEIQTPSLTRLERAETDLIIDHLPDRPERFPARVVAEAKAFLVLPADHPLAEREEVELGDLGEEAFVSYHPSLPHRALQLAALQEVGNRPRRTLSASGVETILGFVEAGLGYSVVPWLDPKGPKARGVRTFPIRDPRGALPIHAVWRESRAPHPLLEAALEVAPQPD